MANIVHRSKMQGVKLEQQVGTHWSEALNAIPGALDFVSFFVNCGTRHIR